MAALPDKTETAVPTEADSRIAAESSRILAKLPRERALHVQLEDGQTLVLPGAAARLLSHLLAEMGRGNAVTLIPIHAELTTQEAADFLNVSRPYLIRLLETAQIPFHKTGTHRRVKFIDLNAYREKMEADRDAAMGELAAQAQDLKLGY
jgi:excisionase family DNA binding protein